MPKAVTSWLRCALAAGAFAAAGAISVTPARAAEVAFTLRIEQRQVPANMRLIRVKQGDVVKLQWSADRPVTVHLHGYDIEMQVAPGAMTEMTFTARATGRFPVELHGGESASHESALVTIEVYPQ